MGQDGENGEEEKEDENDFVVWADGETFLGRVLGYNCIIGLEIVEMVGLYLK